MPGTRRAAATPAAAPADNSSAVLALKQENARRCSSKGAAPQAVEVSEEDYSRVCDGDDSDDTIFSACHSPDCDELEVAAGEGMGDYELTYLHNIYQPSDILSAHASADAILPEAVAPPSLNSHVDIVPSAAATPVPQRSSMQLDEDEDEDSQPSTPPRADDAPWCDSNEEGSPPPQARSAPAKPAPAVGKTSGRKRKPVVAMDLSPPPAAKRQASERHAAAAIKIELSDDEGDSDCDSNGRPCAMLDGLEIRPEDDPLGLFSRDPSTLTAEEQRLLKKQRRLLKNRESAQLSRHRKKMHLHSLEKQVDALKKEKAALAVRVQALQDDNDRLRKQLLTV